MWTRIKESELRYKDSEWNKHLRTQREEQDQRDQEQEQTDALNQ